MLDQFFDHAYMISMEDREDKDNRIVKATENCQRIGLNFQLWPAVNGWNLDTSNVFTGSEEEKRIRWNPGAYGLIKSTVEIIKDAKDKGYKSILIMEDDVNFKDNINNIVNSTFNKIPADWEMIQFGSSHLADYTLIARNISRIRSAYCLHCYAISERIYDLLLDMLENPTKPLDHYTAYDIHPRGNSYAYTPNLVTQFASYSDIAKAHTYYFQLDDQ